MTVELDLLQAVNESPDDDAPRLAYADFVASREPDYAEFVRLQIARSAAERREHALTGRASARERELLAKHYAKWGHYIQRYVRDAPLPREDDQGWGFDRGFIAFVRMEPENFVALGERLFTMAPVQHADLYGGEGNVRPLFAAPQLARLDSLSLRNAGLDDDDAIALANCDFLRRAAWLDLSDNKIGERGVEALAASAVFANKVVVMMDGNPCNPCDRPSWDWDGSLAFAHPSRAGARIEEKLGRRVAWFHYVRRGAVPDRFHAKWCEPLSSE